MKKTEGVYFATSFAYSLSVPSVDRSDDLFHDQANCNKIPASRKNFHHPLKQILNINNIF